MKHLGWVPITPPSTGYTIGDPLVERICVECGQSFQIRQHDKLCVRCKTCQAARTRLLSLTNQTRRRARARAERQAIKTQAAAQ